MEAAGINGCQGIPWSEELDGKELHRALRGEYNLKPRGYVFSGTPSAGANTALRSIYKCDIMIVLMGAVFLHDLLYC